MSTSMQGAVRKLLRASPDGMTVAQITAASKIQQDSLSRILRLMQDAYIDRWVGPTRGLYSAVWCVVIPPKNCPHPVNFEVK